MLLLLADLNHAVRSLRKSPALVVVGVLSLALGLGANVTIYSIVREMVLDDISARQSDRLVRLAADVPYSRYRELRNAGVFQDQAFNVSFTDVNWISDAHGEVAWHVGIIRSPVRASFLPGKCGPYLTWLTR